MRKQYEGNTKHAQYTIYMAQIRAKAISVLIKKHKREFEKIRKQLLKEDTSRIKNEKGKNNEYG